MKSLSLQLAEANRELDSIAKRLEKRSTTLVDAEGKRKDAVVAVKGLQKKNLLLADDLQALTGGGQVCGVNGGPLTPLSERSCWSLTTFCLMSFLKGLDIWILGLVHHLEVSVPFWWSGWQLRILNSFSRSIATAA